jgi:DNA-binding NarL/FixJ family response regulator
MGDEAAMRIVIADDHSLFRDGMRHVLSALSSDVSVMEAGTFAEVLALIEDANNLDLIILDLSMPGMNGAESIAQVKGLTKGAPIVVISASEDRDDVMGALDAGATGYIPKSVRGQVMLSALQLVMVGGTYVPTLVLEDHGNGTPRGNAAACANLRAILTERQIDVLRLLAEGRPNKEIARHLHLAEGTVRVHVNAVLKALSARNRTEAALAARNAGLF